MDIESLYRKYRPELLRYATRLTHNRDTAEDLVEEAFVKAMSYQTDEELGLPWLKRVAKNIFYNTYKRNKRIILEVDTDSNKYNEIPDKIDNEKEVELQGLIEKLNLQEREIIKMVNYGKTQKEIGVELGLNQANISRKIKKIRNKLK